MMSRQVLIALLFLSTSSSALAAEGGDLERATQACAIGALALGSVAEKLAYDIDAVESDQGREAFLAELESFDKHYHDMPTFKAIWLLSLSDALSRLRQMLDTNDRAVQGLHVTAARIKQIRASTWEYANTTLQDVCMFRAGKLAGQGKL
jgi:DNA repair ATPase RecN